MSYQPNNRTAPQTNAGNATFKKGVIVIAGFIEIGDFPPNLGWKVINLDSIGYQLNTPTGLQTYQQAILDAVNRATPRTVIIVSTHQPVRQFLGTHQNHFYSACVYPDGARITWAQWKPRLLRKYPANHAVVKAFEQNWVTWTSQCKNDNFGRCLKVALTVPNDTLANHARQIIQTYEATYGTNY
ncbi:hypothetical protein VTJ49DRAFT_6578 [Mycothermus thermophilus]|uniref:Uncharacterized protein n=1 Tax=Humicola insolens TaxID=85995 RepID=A0ABR3VKB9_HUMIN